MRGLQHAGGPVQAWTAGLCGMCMPRHFAGEIALFVGVEVLPYTCPASKQAVYGAASTSTELHAVVSTLQHYPQGGGHQETMVH